MDEDDFIEHERCTQRPKDSGISPQAIEALALRCQECRLSRPCIVERDNLFLGARTC